MFETSPDPARPHNTLVVRGATDAAYRKIHLYDSFGYRESDRLLAGDRSSRPWSSVGGWQVGLITCYDLRFPELARLLVDARGRGAGACPRRGSPASARWTTGRRCCAPGRSRTPSSWPPRPSPGPRYSGHSMAVDPLGDVLVEAGDGPEVLRARLDHATLTTARATNPSLANRRL